MDYEIFAGSLGSKTPDVTWLMEAKVTTASRPPHYLFSLFEASTTTMTSHFSTNVT
jgi:hypothetical protein